MKDNMERTLQVETLPQLPLRGLVLYPQEILHFDVGRNRSLCALNQAMAQDQRIFLTAQKDVQTESPEETDLFSVGVVAKIKQVLKLPGAMCGCWWRAVTEQNGWPFVSLRSMTSVLCANIR